MPANADALDGAHVVLARGTQAGERSKVVTTDQVLCCGAHVIDVEREPDVPRAAEHLILDRSAVVVVNRVAIELAARLADRVKRGWGVDQIDQRDIVGERIADGRQQLLRRDRAFGAQMRDLPECMHAGVGATRADHAQRRTHDPHGGLLDGFLHGARRRLALPAVKGGAVVGEREFERASRH